MSARGPLITASPFAIRFPPRPTGEIEIVNDIGQLIALVLPAREEAKGIRPLCLAVLFAAAPALFEALKECVLQMVREDPSNEELLYWCDECQEEGQRSPYAIEHAADCFVGRGFAAIALVESMTR